MADDILKSTLQGTLTAPQPTPRAMVVPDSTGKNKQDIQSLKVVQQQPSAMLSLQKAMQLSSRVAYNQRQESEMGLAGQQFDPTKVSGGTFAGIIGNLEAKRGTDISKIYGSTMQTYQVVQQEITRRLERLQEIEEEKRRWEAEMKQRKKELERLKEQDERAYKMEKEKFEMAKKDWELQYSKASKGASGYSSDYLNNLVSGFSQITQGEDGYLDPREFNQWSKDALSNATTKSDLSALSSYLTRARDLLNPADRGEGGREL